MKRIILIILATMFMSSKNDTPYIIYVRDMPNMVVCGVDEKGKTEFIDNDAMALKFGSTYMAQQYILDLSEGVDFFGTRPIRK